MAEAGAYIVCGRVGLSSDPYTLPNLASWGTGDPNALRKLVKEAGDVGRSIADQVAPLELTVEKELEPSLDADLPEHVREMS